jgi:CRP/FNR family cyclic AMP-dependent transcriptional regulator
LLEAERLAVITTVFSCGRDSAVALDAVVTVSTFPNKTIVANQGRIASHCWLVADGLAQARVVGPDGQEAMLATYGPGEFFGSYPEPAPLRADIVAAGTLSLFAIRTGALADLARHHADIACGLSLLLARQLDIMLDRMASRTTLSASGRVYAELLRMAGDSHRIEPPPVLAALAMNVHTTRETTSRAITHLVRRGIVRKSDKALEIVAPRQLAALVA